MKSKQFQYLPCSYFLLLYRFKKKHPRIYVIFNIIKPFFYIIFKYFLTKNRTMFFSNLYNLRNIFLVFMQDGVVMNIKIKIGLFVFIVIGVIVLNITYKNKIIKTKGQSNLAIMIKGDSGEYVSSNEIPKGNYVLNEEKTICENGGKVVSYNNSTGQIGFSFLGSDRCSLYFDKILDTEKPVIKNLNVNDKTVTAVLTDNIELSGYGISSSNTIEPTNWISINGTSYNLSTTITTEGIYYLWVKDSSGNKIVSDSIDLEKKGYQTILINNGGGATTVDDAINYIKGKGTPNFANTATTNEGMYAAEDDLGTSYYFRGAVNNNWVKFGKDSSNNDMYWRIIRINGDGSIRMIYSGTTAPTSSTAIVMTGADTQIGINGYNNDANNPSHVGYMYTLGTQHGSSTSSTIKTAIDNWYKTTTLETDTSSKKLIANQIFCNDRSATTTSSGNPGEISGGMSGSTYYYAPFIRLNNNKAPILTCNISYDKFTLKTSSYGNKMLDYPVGLINADEAYMAGGIIGASNSSYYLYTNQTYWTISPSQFVNGGFMNFVIILSGGLTLYRTPDANYGVRPVINISPSAKLLGDGTYNNVYTVS